MQTQERDDNTVMIKLILTVHKFLLRKSVSNIKKKNWVFSKEMALAINEIQFLHTTKYTS